MGSCQSIPNEDNIKNEKEKKDLIEYQNKLKRDNKQYLLSLPSDFHLSKKVLN